MPPLRVLCPFCKTPCLVEEKLFGFPVQCGMCKQAFIAKAPAKPPAAPPQPKTEAKPVPPLQPKTEAKPAAPEPEFSQRKTAADMTPKSAPATGPAYLDIGAATSVGR